MMKKLKMMMWSAIWAIAIVWMPIGILLLLFHLHCWSTAFILPYTVLTSAWTVLCLYIATNEFKE